VRFLAELVQARAEFQLSFRKGRNGWTFGTPLAFEEVRTRLAKWCDRCQPIHLASGRYFAQPNSRYLRYALSRLPDLSAPASFSTPQRVERLRRLRPFLYGQRARGASAGLSTAFERLALRLDGLAWSRTQDGLWKHMGLDFDELWRTTPLYCQVLSPLQRQVLQTLVSASAEKRDEFAPKWEYPIKD